jgi:hypothetical protein
MFTEVFQDEKKFSRGRKRIHHVQLVNYHGPKPNKAELKISLSLREVNNNQK